jgi:lipopolysaccharide biosynthesis glycosyltransferase
VPTLVAALDVCAQHAVTSAADVVVLLIDFTEDVREGLSAEFTATGMDFLCLKSAQFLPPENVFFNKTHVPRTALGRFAIDDVLPENYLHILYLDGDVRVIGDISPLVLHDVASGYIAAANEYLWLCENDRGAFWQRHHAYLKNIGISNPGDYFNSGVLAFRRDTWKTMSRKALEYFNRHADICLYHDQSALNAVFNGRREILPLSYNFGTKYADLGLENTVKPRIIHFTGGCKPWFFSGKPWNGRFIQDYQSLLLKHPFLKAYWKVPSAADLSAMVATDKRMRRRSALLTPWRTTVKKARFRRYQEATPFQV